jgi:drug/metabolite transporter (DMT)-like permease
MKLSERPPHWLVWLILSIGILAISTAAILVRLASLSADKSGVGFSLAIAAARLTLASLLLIPAWPRISWQALQPGALAYAGAAGVCLAFHFTTWTTSLSYTSIAASTSIVTTNPLWVALLSWLWLKQKLTKKTIVGIALALSGGLIIGLADLGPGHLASNPLLGNFLALTGAWGASLYFLFGQQAQARGFGIGGYIAVAYSLAAAILLPLSLIFGPGYFGYPPSVYFYLLLMALLPQLIGHTSFNWAVRWLSPTVVTLAILFEPVGSSFLAFLLFQEVPSYLLLIGAVFLLFGVAIAALGTRKTLRSNR